MNQSFMFVLLSAALGASSPALAAGFLFDNSYATIETIKPGEQAQAIYRFLDCRTDAEELLFVEGASVSFSCSPHFKNDASISLEKTSQVVFGLINGWAVCRGQSIDSLVCTVHVSPPPVAPPDSGCSGYPSLNNCQALGPNYPTGG